VETPAWPAATGPTPLLRELGALRDGVQPSDPTLIAAGDIAGCGHDRDTATAALLDSRPGTVVATLGDNVYPDGTASEFASCYEPTWGTLRSITRPAAGNHDYHVAGAAAYYDYFGSAAGAPARGYYSYELGAWHVVVLNSNCGEVGGCERDSAQARWLADDLAAHPAACSLAYWHHPRFSSGEHGSDDRYTDFWEILSEHGADVVLNGHDHDYERFDLQNALGEIDSTHGLREFVVGTGGAPLRAFDTTERNSLVRQSSAHGVLRLTLHATSYDWRFEPVSGASFTDSGRGVCVSAIRELGPAVANRPALRQARTSLDAP
jgi:hypothetical protein